MRDLIILVADKNAHFALTGAFSRNEALGVRPLECDFIVHPGRDGGVRKTGCDLLRLERSRFSHGLLVLDFEGSGAAHADGEALEAELDDKLASDWGSAAKAIVIQPELDIWMWGSDNAVEQAIGWPSGTRLRDWIQRHGFELDANGKPNRPKEALEAALRVPRLPRSSALYQNIAKTISLTRCRDAAFSRLRTKLSEWFPGAA